MRDRASAARQKTEGAQARAQETRSRADGATASREARRMRRALAHAARMAHGRAWRMHRLRSMLLLGILVLTARSPRASLALAGFLALVVHWYLDHHPLPLPARLLGEQNHQGRHLRVP